MTRYHVSFGRPGAVDELWMEVLAWVVVAVVALGIGLGLRALLTWLTGWPGW